MVLNSPTLSWIFTGLFGLLTVYSVTRVFTTSTAPARSPVVAGSAAPLAAAVECGCSDTASGERVSNLAHAVMAAAMAMMFTPAPVGVPPAVWLAVFALMAVWFGAGLLRVPGSAPWTSAARHHLMGALAMVSMAAMSLSPHGMAMGGDHSEHGGSGSIMDVLDPVLTTGLFLYFAADTLWSARQLFGTGRPARLANACRVLMGVGMAVMLGAML